MKISISAYSKNMDPHRVFKGKLKKEDIKDWPSPSGFKGGVRCSPIILENKMVEHHQHVFLNDDGEFEPGVQINVAANLTLHGKYRLYQQFDKDELILMLASVLKKSDIREVFEKIETLVEA